MREVVVALVVLSTSAVFVLGSAFYGATAETPEAMTAVEYGWPIAFAESDATRGASLRELRSGEIPFPAAVPFNPWEDPTKFDGAAYLASWALVSGFLFGAIGIFRLLRRGMRAGGRRRARQPVDSS
jgi:hypothetical protein